MQAKRTQQQLVDDWATMAETMAVLNCSRSTVDRLRDACLLKSIRRFNRVLISRESIRKFNESTLKAR